MVVEKDKDKGMQKCPRANQEGEGEGNHPQIKPRTAIANILNTDTTDYMANKPTEQVLLDKEIKGYFSPVFLRQLLAASRSNRKPYVHSCQKIFGCNSLQFPKLSGFPP